VESSAPGCRHDHHPIEHTGVCDRDGMEHGSSTAYSSVQQAARGGLENGSLASQNQMTVSLCMKGKSTVRFPRPPRTAYSTVVVSHFAMIFTETFHGSHRPRQMHILSESSCFFFIVSARARTVSAVCASPRDGATRGKSGLSASHALKKVWSHSRTRTKKRTYFSHGNT